MEMVKLSQRKLESYQRAEKVAQASRHLVTVIGTVRCTQKDMDLWSGLVLDWMKVAGKLRYDIPTRRKRAIYR